MTVTLMAPVAARREGAAARDSPDGGSDTAGGASREARGLKIGSIRRMRASYKHVPHREKPPQVVARRNARERRRVQAVNAAFCRLRRAVPTPSRGRCVSKVRTLQLAIEYIRQLRRLIDEFDARAQHRRAAAGAGCAHVNGYQCATQMVDLNTRGLHSTAAPWPRPQQLQQQQLPLVVEPQQCSHEYLF